MNKFSIILCILFALNNFIILSCSNNDTVEEYTSREIVIITLKIDDFKEVNKIELIHNGTLMTLLKPEFINKKEVKLKFPNSGEGTFKLCIETMTENICSNEAYIEGGYRPIILFKDNKIEFIKHS